MNRFLGGSLRQPEHVDSGGATIYNHPQLKSALLRQKYTVLRHPAGTHSYDITDTDDTDRNNFVSNWLSIFPDAINDFTWPPYVTTGSLNDWYNSKTGKITLANEPPLHAGTDPEDHFADGAAYVTWAISQIENHPLIPFHKFWIQSGKPEFLSLESAVNEGTKADHQDFLNASSAAVLSGSLPAQITSTHKIYAEEFTSDRWRFYQGLVEDYRSYYGNKVKVAFNEFKVGNNDVADIDTALSYIEMACCACRLFAEYDGFLDGLIYQQLSAIGPVNHFYLDESDAWNQGVTGKCFELMSEALYDTEYIPTEREGRPDLVMAEKFIKDGSKEVILFSNRRSEDVALNEPSGGDLYVINSSLDKERRIFNGVLPARSCGVIFVRSSTMQIK